MELDVMLCDYAGRGCRQLPAHDVVEQGSTGISPGPPAGPTGCAGIVA